MARKKTAPPPKIPDNPADFEFRTTAWFPWNSDSREAAGNPNTSANTKEPKHSEIDSASHEYPRSGSSAVRHTSAFNTESPAPLSSTDNGRSSTATSSIAPVTPASTVPTFALAPAPAPTAGAIAAPARNVKKARRTSNFSKKAAFKPAHKEAGVKPEGVTEQVWAEAYNSEDYKRYMVHGKDSKLSTEDRKSGLTRTATIARLKERGELPTEYSE